MLDDSPWSTESEHDHTTESATELSVTLVFELLANEYRRALLRSLVRTDGNVARVPDLRDALKSRARDERTSPNALSIELHHHHLPKLEHAGIIEYDARSKMVRYRGDPLVERCLEVVADCEE